MNPRWALLPALVVAAAVFPVTGAADPTVDAGRTWTAPPDRAEAPRADHSGHTAERAADRAAVLTTLVARRAVTTATARPVVVPVRPVPRVAAPSRPAGPTWEQRRGAEAMALVTYPWRDLGWRISFHGPRPGVLGIADAMAKHIHVYVRRSQSARLLAFTVAHEIGHAYDFTRGTRESRLRWLELRGIDRSTPWFGCDGCGDLETPAGDFAEVFAMWQVGPVDYRSRMAPPPTGAEMDVLSQEFAA